MVAMKAMVVIVTVSMGTDTAFERSAALRGLPLPPL